MGYTKYTVEILAPLVRDSKSYSDVMRKLGLKPSGGNLTHIGKLIRQLELDTSHFEPHYKKANSYGGSNKLSWKQVLVEDRNGRREKASVLRRALLDSGRQYCCESCGNDGEWLGQTLTLHVDHKDGNFIDNRPENIRFLCPNCHSQTENYGKKKEPS